MLPPPTDIFGNKVGYYDITYEEQNKLIDTYKFNIELITRIDDYIPNTIQTMKMFRKHNALPRRNKTNLYNIIINLYAIYTINIGLPNYTYDSQLAVMVVDILIKLLEM